MQASISSRGTIIALVALGGVSWLAGLPKAQACSGMAAGIVTSRQVFPSDGSTGVPTNVHIAVSYWATMPRLTDHFQLTTSSGGPVPIVVSEPVTDPKGNPMHQAFVVTPSTVLAPNTKYLLFSDYAKVPCLRSGYAGGPSVPPCSAPDVDGGAADGGAATPSAAIATFTTGTGPDNTQPTISGEMSYTSARDTCNNGACCGPYDGYSVSLAWPNATDSGGPVIYELSRDGEVILYPMLDSAGDGPERKLQAFILCSGTMAPLVGPQVAGPSGTYQVVAIDQAGNRSTPIRKTVTLDCSPGDGGTPDATNDDRDTATDGPAETPDVPATIDLLEAGGAITTDGALARDSALGAGGAIATGGSAGAGGALAMGGALPTGGQQGSAGSTGTANLDAATTPQAKNDPGCSCQLGSRREGPAGLAAALLSLALILHNRRLNRHPTPS